MASSLYTETVEYKVVSDHHNDLLLQGYLAYDRSSREKRPGIMIVHDALGIKPYIKNQAEKLAQEHRCVAFAADMYGKGNKPKDIWSGVALANQLKKDRLLIRSRAKAGLNILLKHPFVDVRRLAALGYSFGGTTVLELARGGVKLAGVVSYHGSLDTPAVENTTGKSLSRPIKAKILIFHGASDPLIPIEQITNFYQEMEQAHADWQLVIYGGVGHSFTNPSAGKNPPIPGVAYHQQADQRSWNLLTQFLKELGFETLI